MAAWRHGGPAARQPSGLAAQRPSSLADWRRPYLTRSDVCICKTIRQLAYCSPARPQAANFAD